MKILIDNLSNNNLFLVRHGQSTYNLENRFTGWKDVDLTDKGIQEAKNASKLLKDYNINAAYTSKLKRAQNTLSIILDNLDFTHDPDIDNESTKIVNLTGIIKINKIKLQK